MSYPATVYRVFIASPGDVLAERQYIRDAVWDWNTINAAIRGVVLEPVSWETHAHPEMGGHPQTLINKQLLSDADLLVAVFWTRLGTATGTHASGTVEEIERHLESGKPAMIYFSDTPVKLDSVDDAQYKALRDFRKQLEVRGLIQSYSSLAEFTTQFTRHLHQRVNTLMPSSVQQAIPVVAPPERPGLSNEALDLLSRAVAADGHIMMIRATGGMYVIKIGAEQIDTSSARLSAKWAAAVEELADQDFIRDSSGRGTVFQVTKMGYDIIDALGM